MPDNIALKILTNVASKKAIKSTNKVKGNALALSFQKIQDELVKHAGISRTVAPWAAMQIMYESAAAGKGPFTSNLYKTHRNPGGIKYYKGQPGATQGNKSPEGNFYAKFDSPQSALKEYGRILNKKPGVPAKATSFDDYVDRLKLNNYFTDDKGRYKKNMQAMLKYTGTMVIPAAQKRATAINKQATADRKEHQTKMQQGAEKRAKRDFNLENLKDTWAKIPVWGKGVIVIGSGYLLIKLVRS